jgi:hypothetical protein
MFGAREQMNAITSCHHTQTQTRTLQAMKQGETEQGRSSEPVLANGLPCGNTQETATHGSLGVWVVEKGLEG